jgi:hypothetical protein
MYNYSIFFSNLTQNYIIYASILSFFSCVFLDLLFLRLGMKTTCIFFDSIRDRIRLEGFKSVRIRVRIFNIRYRIRIRIFKSHIYDVDIQSYSIRHFLYYPYSNPNPDINMKTNTISVISVRIRYVFIPTYDIKHYMGLY